MKDIFKSWCSERPLLVLFQLELSTMKRCPPPTILTTVQKQCENPCKGIQNSLGFLIPCHRFLIPGTGIPVLVSGIWILDSGFQSLVGFRILWTVFRIPRPRISVFTLSKFFPDFGFHEQNFPHSGIRNPDFLTWGEMWQNRNSYFVDCRLSHLRKGF